MDYQWQLALGDEPLTESELKTLTELKTPLVRLRGQWVELDAKRLAAGAQDAHLGRADDRRRPAPRWTVHTRTVPAACRSSRSPPRARSATCWPARSTAASSRCRPRPASPARCARTRNGVWPGSRFLERLGLGSILADDMGLGKSATVLALLLGRAERRTTDAAGLSRCRWSATGSARSRKFAPELRVHVHHGAERAKGKEFTDAVAGADLVITTYALAARDAAALTEIAWHRVVVDEAQAIKNAATRQAVAVRALPARHRIAVTGTPVENRLADLWSIMEFANPGLLGSARRSRPATPSRSSGAATRRRPSGSSGSPARSCCAA